MKSRKILWFSLATFVASIASVRAGLKDIDLILMLISIATTLVVFPIALIRELTSRRRSLKRAKKKAVAEDRRKKLQALEDERLKARTIVDVKYLGLGATKQKRGGLKGALLGGFFGGTMGAVVGAAIPKNTEGLHRFAVKYEDGHVEIKDLSWDSWECKKLIEMVKWDEL